MPACPCCKNGTCPHDDVHWLKARVAALEQLERAGGPEPAAGDHKGKQVPYPGQQQRDSRPAPEQAAQPQQPREGGGA